MSSEYQISLDIEVRTRVDGENSWTQSNKKTIQPAPYERRGRGDAMNTFKLSKAPTVNMRRNQVFKTVPAIAIECQIIWIAMDV